MFDLEKQALKPFTFKFYIIGVIIASIIIFPICLNEFAKISFSFSSLSTFILLIAEIFYNSVFYIIASFSFGIASYGIIYAAAILILSAKNHSGLFNHCLAFIAVLGAVFLFLFSAYKTYGVLNESELDKERKRFDSNNDYVYVTETGSKYHLSNCPSLKSIADEMYVCDAEDEGYEPCKVCDPPTD